MVELLSSMIKKNSRWSWGDEQEKSYHQIMKKLEEQLKLHHFDPNLVTKVYTDASPVGLGAIMCQRDKDGNERTIQCISRTLSNVERRYSQTERERERH